MIPLVVITSVMGAVKKNRRVVSDFRIRDAEQDLANSLPWPAPVLKPEMVTPE